MLRAIFQLGLVAICFASPAHAQAKPLSPAARAAKKMPRLPGEKNSFDYEWIVEKGKVVGCTETANIALTEDPLCGELPFTPLECVRYIEKEKILDTARCATKIHTVHNWLDKEGEICAEFALVQKNGTRSKFFLRATENQSLCSHTWLAPETKQGECYFQEAGQFAFHPLGELSLDKLVPEILALAKKEPVPEEVYQKYGSREIAASLVYKLHQDYKPLTDTKPGNFDYLENSEIQIAFPMARLEAIRARGFLNQHQTKHSLGLLSPEERTQTENGLAGRDLSGRSQDEASGKKDEVKPKYAFFVPTASREDQEKIRHVYSPLYGDVIAVLAPAVKDRTTFTNTDSLRTESADGLDAMFRLTPKGNKLPVDRGYDTYWEAQIWGELTVQQDVGYFLWGCFAGRKDYTYSPEELKKLKATGKPVYQCELDRTSGDPSGNSFTNELFRRGKQL